MAALAACLALPFFAAPAGAFDPSVEAQNFSKTQERSSIFDTPQYQLLLRQVSLQNREAAMEIQVSDPERNFSQNVCQTGEDGCAGDVRLYDWGPKGYGLVRPVLYTARDGATISGHVWATRDGPAKRPLIVITNGSVQADEQLYWFVAQTLAKDGYVVLTTDPQGQGQSDDQGEAPDQNEGYPAQSDGRPFFDGTEDAINFALSTPAHPYEPARSCTTGTVHSAKQDRRVKEGLGAAYNPFWQFVDPTRLGIAGHSYGAAGVSYIGQWDPRVKAIVAWDNLSGADPSKSLFGGSGAPEEQPCPSTLAARTPAPITKPALGMSADYGLPATPNSSQPDPEAKTTESLTYTKDGVDTGELIIRGGSHLDFSWIPNSAFSGSLRGADMINWYTAAWFDKYVKGDPSADARLLTNRWRHDGDEASIDPNHDGNVFSFYYRSRLDIHLAGGGVFDCENMRPGCPGLSDNDGHTGDYSYLGIDTSPDGSGPGASGSGSGTVALTSGIYPCTSQQARTFRLHRLRGKRIVKVRVYVGRRLLVQRTGRALRTVTVPGLPGTIRRAIVIDTYTRGGLARRTRRMVRGCAAKGRPKTVKVGRRAGRRRRA